MTLLLPTIFYSTIKFFIKIMDTADYATKYIKQDLPSKLISWHSYLFFLAIISMLSSCHLMVSGLMSIPIYFWMLLWHPDICSIFDMLCNPKGNCCLVQYDNNNTCPRWREQFVLYHDGHGVNAIVEFGFICPIIQKPFPFRDMTQDVACSHITRYF
jgi:hypothetical protein